MKKFVAFTLAVFMVVAMTACGSNEAAPAAQGSKDAAATTFKLGTQGPLTGGAAVYGQAVANAAQIAVDEINASGWKYKFEFKAADDEADSGDKAINAYNSLMDWGMQVMAGTVTSGAGATVSKQAYKDRLFCLTPSGSSTDVIKDNDNTFQVCFTDPNQGVASADYIAEKFPGKTVAVIYKNDDNYSQGIQETFVAEAAKKNLNIVYQGTFNDATSTEFTTQVAAAKAAGAGVVFLPIYYTPASVILNNAKQANYSPVFFGVDGMDGILSLEGFDKSLAEGVYLLTPFSADAKDDLTQNFVKKYKEKFGEVPNQFAADAYDAVYILKEALDKANCTPDMSPEAICEELVKVFPSLNVDGLTGKGMTWAATGEVSKAPMAIVIKNGEYVTPQ